MAWYYPKHACGHDGERVQLLSSYEGRKSILDGIERQNCHACRMEQAQKDAAAMGIPTLTGTPKQIVWASDIRARFISAGGDTRLVSAHTDARWWIDNRYAFADKIKELETKMIRRG